MLTQAILILPKLDNDGRPLDAVHFALELDLMEAFGGFTATESRGGWIDADDGKEYRDDGVLYLIAADFEAKGRRLRRRLENIAGRYAREARQVSVYVAHADGEVVLCAPLEPREGFGPDSLPYADRVKAQFGVKAA